MSTAQSYNPCRPRQVGAQALTNCAMHVPASVSRTGRSYHRRPPVGERIRPRRGIPVSAGHWSSALAVNRDPGVLALRFPQAVERALAECHARGLAAFALMGFRLPGLQAC